ncbi:hypothetical protein M3Y99_01708400 [Aphelenchoides fujianensis]|nr:hypothetical protein M3Y99_01708400 [Aphelenchoides fujianensis]
MASDPKKPRLEEPTARPRPRLPAKGRRCVQQFLIEARQPSTPKLLPLLISQSFVNAYFESEEFGTLEIGMGTQYIWLAKRKPGVIAAVPFSESTKEITELLRLTRSLTAIRICWSLCWGRTNVRLMNVWMRIANELHDRAHWSAVATIKNTAERMAAELRQAGFGSESAAEGGETTNDAELQFLIVDYHNWKVVTRTSVAARFGWTDAGELRGPNWRISMPTYSSVHCGVRILFGLEEKTLW